MSKKNNHLLSFLFVCLGNICRSPALKGILEDIAQKKGTRDQIEVKSCGLHSSFIGNPPHKKMQKVATQHGILLQDTAKLLEEGDLASFDLIFGVNAEIVSFLSSKAKSKEEKAKIYLATEFSSKYPKSDIPDPYYYADIESFEKVWDLMEDACIGIYARFVEPRGGEKK